jgi:hypothetical protein
LNLSALKKEAHDLIASFRQATGTGPAVQILVSGGMESDTVETILKTSGGTFHVTGGALLSNEVYGDVCVYGGASDHPRIFIFGVDEADATPEQLEQLRRARGDWRTHAAPAAPAGAAPAGAAPPDDLT